MKRLILVAICSVFLMGCLPTTFFYDDKALVELQVTALLMEVKALKANVADLEDNQLRLTNLVIEVLKLSVEIHPLQKEGIVK